MPLLNFISGGIVVFLLSYMVGSIPCGFLIGKFNGLDIRHHGSHNIGATNVRRTLGKDWGLICFMLDFLKGLLPVVLIGALVWLVTFFTVRIVSIASMAAAVGIAVSSLIMLLTGTGDMHWSIPLLLFAIAALIITRHKENITRLREGREHTFVKIKPRK